MNISKYLNIINRRKWVILFTFVVTMSVVVLGTHFQTPIYQASTTLRIATSSLSQANYSDYVYSDRLMNTYIEISSSPAVQAELMKRLNLTKPPIIKAEILPNTELIKITIEDANPNMAANEANNLANILITQTSQLYTGGGLSSATALGDQLAQANQTLIQRQQDYQKLLIETPPATDKIEVARQALTLQQNIYSTLLYQYNQATLAAALQANMVTIIDRAQPPQSPSRPKIYVNYALGLMLGLLAGLGLAFVFENLDNTVYTLDDIESITKFDTLAKVTKANKKQLDIFKNDKSPFAVALLNLAAKIQLLDRQHTRKVIILMSPESQQGKSTIVANLAYALAESGKKVVAVDCDLHLPQLHVLFGLTNEHGLSDFLNQNADLKSSLQKSQSDCVTVLTSGPLPDNASKLLGSPQMAELVEELKKKYDYVLLDPPALLSFTDTEILAQYADSLIMVVRQGLAKKTAVQSGSKFLALYPDKTLGYIVNGTKDEGDYGYYQLQHRSKLSKRSQEPKISSVFERFGIRIRKK
jgi:capsular exopolysaccharide synthesis family protein